MNTEQAEKGEQYPSDPVGEVSRPVAQIGLLIHPGNQEQVNQPADAEQTEGEKIDGSADRLAIIETVRSGKTEDPQDIADSFQVRAHDPCISCSTHF